MINEKRQASALAMVEQLLERKYTPEAIALQLQCNVRRVTALINELERRKAAEDK